MEVQQRDARARVRDPPTPLATWTTYAADHTRPLLDAIREHQEERDLGGLVVVVRTKLQATLVARHLRFPNQVMTLASFLGVCSAEAIRDEDVLPTFVRHQLIRSALPPNLPETHRHHLAKEVDRAIHLLDMHGIDLPSAPPHRRPVHGGPPATNDGGVAADDDARRAAPDGDGVFGALDAGSRAMREAARRFREDALFFPGARVTAAAEGPSRIRVRFPSCHTVAFIGIDHVSPRERAAIQRVTEVVRDVLWYVIGEPTRPEGHDAVGDEEPRPAFRHTAPLMAWLGTRGQVHVLDSSNNTTDSTAMATALHPWLPLLFGDRPVPAQPAPHVAVGRPRTVADEVEATVHRIVEALEDGTRPERIAVVSPDLASYAGSLTRHLRRLRIPFAVSLPGKTRDTAAGTLLQILINALRDGPTHRHLFDLADHPLAALHGPTGGPPIAASRWRRMFLERNLRPYSPAQWAEAVERCRERPGLELPDPRDGDADRQNHQHQNHQHRDEWSDWLELQGRALLAWVQRIDDARRSAQRATTTGLFDTLRDLIDGCRVPQGVTRAARESTHPTPLVEGYARVLELIDEIEDGFLLIDGARSGAGTEADHTPDRGTPPPAMIVLDALAEALRSDTLRPTGDPHHGVQVLGLRNLRGAVFDQVHLLGCSQQALPGPDHEDALCRLLETRMGLRFERIDPAREARFLIHNLLADTRGKVFITCPRLKDDEEVPLSIIIEELLDVIEPTDEPYGSTRFLTSHAQHAAAAREALPLPREVLDARPDLVARMELVRARSVGDDRSPYAGRVSHPEDAVHASPLHTDATTPEALRALHAADDGDQPPPEISVRRLERYATCPQRHLYEHTFGLRAPDPRTDDVSPLDRGILLHGILQHYAHERLGEEPDGFLVGTDANAAARLYEIAITLMDPIRDDSLPWQTFRRSLLSGLDHPDNPARDGPPGILRRFIDHETNHPSRILATEVAFGGDSGRDITLQTPAGTLRLSGRIDRVDAVPSHEMDLFDKKNVRDAGADGEGPTVADPERLDGLRVVDYKTGRPPHPRHVAGGTHFQLPLYLYAASRLYPERAPVSGRYFQLRRPKKAEVGWVTKEPDLPPKLHPADLPLPSEDEETEVADASAQTSPILDAARQWTERLLPERVARIHDAALAGAYNLTLLDEEDAGCGYCDHRRICGLRNHLTRDRVHRLIQDGRPAPEEGATSARDGPSKSSRGKADGAGITRALGDPARLDTYVPARCWPTTEGQGADEPNQRPRGSPMRASTAKASSDDEVIATRDQRAQARGRGGS